MNDLDERLASTIARRESRTPQAPVPKFDAIHRGAERQRIRTRAGAAAAGVAMSAAAVAMAVSLPQGGPTVVVPGAEPTTSRATPPADRLGSLLASIPTQDGRTITLRHNAAGFSACDEKGSSAGCVVHRHTIDELGSTALVRGDIFGLAPARTSVLEATTDDRRKLPVNLVSADGDAPANAPRLYLVTAPTPLQDDKGRWLHIITLRAVDASGKVVDTEVVGFEDHPEAAETATPSQPGTEQP